MDTAELCTRLARTELLNGAPEEVMAACANLAARVEVAPGEALILAGSRTGSLYLLLGGVLEVRLRGAGDASATLARLGEGEVLGEIQVVTGQAATTDVVAITKCVALRIDGGLMRIIAEGFTAFDERLAQLASRRLRKLVFHRAVTDLLEGVQPTVVDEFIAGASELTLGRGETLFEQGDAADAWFVLTSGRLGVYEGAAEESHKVADLLPGASVGEMALITGGDRNAGVRAERAASLMRVSRSDFERFADEHPAFARRLMATVVRRLTDKTPARKRAGTIVIVVVRASDSPLLEVALGQLGAALGSLAGAAVCTRADFERAMGSKVDPAASETHPLWSRFDVWLEEAQREHPLVVVDAGHADDAWRRECLLNADRCAWLAEPVAEGQAQPAASLHAALRAARLPSGRLPWWLLLAHPAGTLAPRNTRAWLDGQDFDRHFHLRLDDPRSMERTARLLAGKGNGVALSGGGARAFAHIGVLKAFVELGIPIDCIGGTSMGAIQAGMFAMGLSIEEMRKLNREVTAQRPFEEYTLPVVAVVASKRRDASIRHSFGDMRIEDLWIPYLAITTDLRAARAVVHERGSLGLAAGASSSIPGVLVPVVDGDRILVDGGVVDNMPVSWVKQRSGGIQFGVKVAPDDDLLAPAGGFPSAWKVLWHRVVPGLPRLVTPRLGDILVRTMTVGSAERMVEATRSVDVLIEPQVAKIGMLQFKAIDSLIELGYAAGIAALRKWQARPQNDVADGG